MKSEKEPILLVACFCDNVIEDKSGALSLIRIVDTVTHEARGENPPKEMPPFNPNLNLVLILNSGNMRGDYNISVVPETPVGKKLEPFKIPINFPSENRGQNIILRINFKFEMEGLHWFHIIFGERELTSIPLIIVYRPINVGPNNSN
jgi:hypothetical protein